jgi:hypothetical protein
MYSGNLHLTSTPPRFAVRVRAVLAARCKQMSSGLPGRSLAERPKLFHHAFASLRKLAPVFSNTYELFCTLQNVNSHAFNQFRTLSQKHRGGGTPSAGSNPPLAVVLNQRSAAPELPNSATPDLSFVFSRASGWSPRAKLWHRACPLEARLLLRGAL